MEVKISNIIKNIGKNISFMQPVYETIINSLEANANKITVRFFYDEDSSLFGRNFCSINSFEIEDNGEGFNSKNVEAFHELWTDNKFSLGCKGSGRFTWLSVFKNIDIESFVKSEQKHITIPFSVDYSNNYHSVSESVKENKTFIKFSNLTEKFLSNGNYDSELANLDNVYNKIYDYLMFKLFMFKNSGKKFEIKLCIDEDYRIINDESIPNLNEKAITVRNDLFGVSEEFSISYLFKKDGKNEKIAYLYAGLRPAKIINSDDLGFSAPLPNGDSFYIVVRGNYLDKNGNDERNGFPALSNLKSANKEYPILYTHIISEVKRVMKDIINIEYPELEQLNRIQEEKAIESAPFLASFISKNDDIVKSEESVTKAARKAFNERKISVKQNFDSLLKSQEISTAEFDEAVESMTEIVGIELGEYIHYRESIIKALLLAINDASKKENFVHNIFMKQWTETTNDKVYASNFWLLDDKFMSFVHGWSDVQISSITNEKLKGYMLEKDGRRKPDVVLYFNKDENSEFVDAIVIEFKGLNADHDQKTKALTEINENVKALRSYNEKIRNVYCYIITTIDDEFENTLNTTQGYVRRSVSGGERIYYCFNDKVDCHINVLDVESIANEAHDRNSTFLKILTENTNRN